MIAVRSNSRGESWREFEANGGSGLGTAEVWFMPGPLRLSSIWFMSSSFI